MQWAVQSGFKVTLISDSRHDFVIEVSENETLPRLQIIHQETDTAFVLVVGLVKIPETDRSKLKDLKLGQFGQLIWDIKLSLLHAGVDFTALGPEKDPDAWEVQKRLFLDGTNINHFHEAYSKVKNSLIGIIWSYKRALDGSVTREGRSESEEQVTIDKGEAIQGDTDRTQRVMNAITNTSIILMSTLMGGFTQVMMETTGAVASEMAGTMGGEEARDQVDKEFEEKLPEAYEKVKAMISDVRGDIYAQLGQKRKEIEPLISDPVFDLGPKIVDSYDFGLPKLIEELDDDTLARYTQLLIGEDPSFTEMFKELANWMNTLPKFADKSDEE
ncbi:MAG: DUF2299 family protein [Methanomassiliicoccales archaeon]|nr:DUF2299 family protein [Methanomassiliicoccales archaeon]